MRTVLALALTFGATAAVPPAADAARASQPIVMTASGGQQRGAHIESVTTSRGCVTKAGTSRTARPAAVEHDGGTLSWRIPGARRPDRFILRMETVTVTEPTTGLTYHEYTTRQLALTAVRSRTGKVVGWDATTTSTVGYADYDIWLKVIWTGACGNDTLQYRFHALSLPVHP